MQIGLPESKIKRRRQRRQQKGRSSMEREGGDKWFSKTVVGIQSFLPRRTVAVFKQQMNSYYATATAQPQGIFAIQASSFFQPFNTVAIPIGSTGVSKSNLNLIGGFAVNQDPIGYQEVMGLYQYYKVRRVRVRLSATALASPDAFNLYGCPSTNQASSYESVFGPANPYGKSALVGVAQKTKVLTWDISCPTVLGFNPEQFAGLTPTVFGAAPASSQQWFFNVGWQSGNNANPTTGLIVEVELWQEVELSELELFAT